VISGGQQSKCESPESKQQDLSNEGLLALEQRYIELYQSSPDKD